MTKPDGFAFAPSPRASISPREIYWDSRIWTKSSAHAFATRNQPNGARYGFVEALFPGYIFARFDLANDLRAVNASSNVTGVLRFADFYPKISNEYVEELRAEFPEEENEIRIIEPEISEGDEVVLTEGTNGGDENDCDPPDVGPGPGACPPGVARRRTGGRSFPGIAQCSWGKSEAKCSKRSFSQGRGPFAISILTT